MVGTRAAPFLAGFSLTATLVTLSIKASLVPWRDWAMMCFVAAASLFIMTVHATFWSMIYVATPRQMCDWWPEGPNEQELALLRAEQRTHYKGFQMWDKRSRVAYDAGVLFLLIGIVFVLIPPKGHFVAARVTTLAIASAACIIEILWRLVVWLCLRREERREGQLAEGRAPDHRAWYERLLRPQDYPVPAAAPGSPAQPQDGQG
ncbi:hypothetical protein GCM10018783_52350 [Streptomyces griseosporeus]|nr:hypothetical protein GCM10018783_52350 [Streptomyces griseosporeus]